MSALGPGSLLKGTLVIIVSLAPGGFLPDDAPKSTVPVEDAIRQGRYKEAEALARAMLEDAVVRSGNESIPAAKVTDLLVESRLHLGMGMEPETRELAQTALRTKEKLLSQDDLELAPSLVNLATVLRQAGDLGAASGLQERALKIREAALGPDDASVALTLNGLGDLRRVSGDYAGARVLYERALAISQKALGTGHPYVALSLNNLGSVLRDQHQFRESRSHFQQALAILETAFGPDHPQVAWSLNSLGNLLLEMGEYSSARQVYDRALSIWERTLGSAHPRTASTRQNLGVLLMSLGEYTAARRHFESALAISESSLGPENPEMAITLGNLADLLTAIGDYERARKQLERCLRIQESSFGVDGVASAATMRRLAGVHQLMGDHAEAKRLCAKALAIYEKAYGQEHHDVAETLRQLAELLSLERRYAEARAAYERALMIHERELGAQHPTVAESLAGLGNLLRRSGRRAEAKPYLERALAARMETLGPHHPLVASSLEDLAELLFEVGLFDRAAQLALQAEEISRNHLRLTARSLSEEQALRYSATRRSGLGLALSALSRSGGGTEALRRAAWDSVIRSRALVLDEVVARHRSGDPQGPLMKNLRTANERLSHLLVRGIEGDSPERYRRLLDDAREEKEEAERSLAESSPEFRQEETRGRIGLSEVMAALPPASALIAFVAYEGLPSASQSPGGRPEASYMAFAVVQGHPDPIAVPLGTAKEIESLVGRWRKEAGGHTLAILGLVEAEIACRTVGAEVRERVWDPISSKLPGVKQVLVVPDGALNLVSLTALPVGEDEYLVERGPLVHYLSAEKDLVRPHAASAEGNGLLALGGPDYDSSPLGDLHRMSTGDIRPKANHGGLAPVHRGAMPECSDFQSVRFPPLPGAAAEANEVASLWTSGASTQGVAAADLLTGAAASEAAFKARAPGHQVLHLATHGFFLGEECRPAPENARGIGGMAPAGSLADTFRRGRNPLLLSGLALAGANHRGATRAGEEDGILTAEEIAAMDLSGVRLAVLSACDTALGRIRAGEGVSGLRRAFHLAGTGSVITSLWSIEDETARSWMKEFYKARLVDRLGTAEAVRRSSAMLLQERKRRNLHAHPFYWAGFVAAGDWR